jgi:hypothetical protein
VRGPRNRQLRCRSPSPTARSHTLRLVSRQAEYSAPPDAPGERRPHVRRDRNPSGSLPPGLALSHHVSTIRGERGGGCSGSAISPGATRQCGCDVTARVFVVQPGARIEGTKR